MIEVSNCPVCLSRFSTPHPPAYGQPVIYVELEGFQIPMSAFVQYRACLECGAHFQSPRMDDETLNRWYESGTYRKWLAQPQSVLDKDEFSRALGIVEWLEPYNPLSNERVLDIGCSRGYLLDMLKQRNPGIEIQGVESNLGYVTEKVPVVADIKELSQTYDILTMIHVLEHVPEPLNFLMEVRKLMHMNSLLIIEVPSERSRGGPHRLAHLTYLPTHALRRCIGMAGMWAVDWVEGEHTRVVCRRSS